MIFNDKSEKKDTNFEEGTINGISTRNPKFIKKEKTYKGVSNFIKFFIGCAVVLLMFILLYWIITDVITHDKIDYKEPMSNEIIEIVAASNENESTERVKLLLEGELTIEVEVGDEYKEPGYKATSDVKGDISDYVIVSGQLDTNTVGTYELTYSLSYKGIVPKLTRLIKVVKKDEISNEDKDEDKDKEDKENDDIISDEEDKDNNDKKEENNSNSSTGSNSSGGSSSSGSQRPSTSNKPQGNITLQLNGNSTKYLTEGRTYVEEGATAVDNYGNNLSSKISISGSVNPNVAGTYKITYSITNYNGQILTVVRNVIVQAMQISLTLSNTNTTNQPINIIVNTRVDNFSRLVLPNGVTVTDQNYTYRVTTNGTYEFIVYNTSGDFRKATIVVKNINKQKPRATCSVRTGDNVTYVTITPVNGSQISKYVYSGVEYTSNVISINRRLASGIQLNIGLYDSAGNYGTVTCIVP